MKIICMNIVYVYRIGELPKGKSALFMAGHSGYGSNAPPPNFQGPQKLLNIFHYFPKSDLDLTSVEHRWITQNIILRKICAWSRQNNNRVMVSWIT